MTLDANRQIEQGNRSQDNIDALREQNRVLRSNLVNCVARLEACYGEDYPAVRDAKAALTATSQPEPCTNHFSDGSKIFPSRDCCKPATSQEGQQ